jgi:hypothetical protein
MLPSRRPLACLAVALALNLATWDLRPAFGQSGEEPDSLNGPALVDTVSAEETSTPSSPAIQLPAFVPEARPMGLAGEDSRQHDQAAGRKAPLYRKWWFWSIVGSTLVTAAIIGAGGGDEARPDLPDFPDPPEKQKP